MPGIIPHLEKRFWRIDIGEGDAQIRLRGRDLLAPPEWVLRAAFGWRGGIVADAWGSLTVRAAGAASTGAAIAALIATREEPLSIVVHQLEGEVDDESASARWSGGITRVDVEDAEIRIEARVVVPGRDLLVCRDLSECAGFSEFPPQTWIPQVFGTCENVEPILLRAPSERAIASGAISRDQTTITLRAPVDWPSTGFVQINDEVLAYNTIMDGITLGSDVAPLERGAPRDHAASSEVWRVDMPGLTWLACDHEATISEVDAGDSPITDWTASTNAIDGRDVTLIHRTLLPLERLESATLAVRDALFGYAGWWELTSSSNALRGSTAFDDKSQTGGAIIALTAPILEADWIGDLSPRLWRHDRIVRALLAFDFTPYPGWQPDTVLRVTVSRGESEVMADLSLDGFVDDVGEEFRTTRSVPEVVQHDFVLFDSVSASGGWSDASHATEGLLSSSPAIATSSGDPETISLSVVKRWPGENTLVTSLRLRVALESAGECAAILRLTDDDELDETIEFDAPAALEQRELEILLSPGRSAQELFEVLRAEVTLAEAGTLSVAEAWLEGTFVEPPEVATIEEAGAAPLPQRAMELDVTSMIEDAFDWEIFNGETPRWRVRFQLIDGSPVSPAVVARVHFRFETFPARVVRPTTHITATMVGRAAGEDGTAPPLEVVRMLLEDPDFASLGESSARDAAFLTAADVLAGSEVRFRRVIQEATTVREALEEACGEARLLLVQAHGDWVVGAAPAMPEDGEPGSLGADAVADLAPNWSFSGHAGLRSPIRRLDASTTSDQSWFAELTDARGRTRAKWCDSGGDELLESINGWLARRIVHGRVRILTATAPLPGTALVVDGLIGGHVQETRALTGHSSLRLDRVAFD